MMASAFSRLTLGCCAALLLLSACTGKEVRNTLGLKRNNPDEFRVVSRPPLSVPPVYHLRPPSEDEREYLNPADERARALLFDNEDLPVYRRASDAEFQADTAVMDVSTGTLGTAGDSLFLQNAKVSQANPDIRAVLREENAPLIIEEKKEKGFFEKLRGTNEEPVVDAEKELERIRANKAEGKPVNEGETPVLDPKEKSVLDRLGEML